jgi:GDP-L-fucose synthase
MNKSSKIYIAGHRGLVGSAIVRRLQSGGFNNLITRKSGDLDLRRQSNVEAFFRDHKPEYVFLAAARVGGIHANNTYPANFIYDNLTIQTNVIHAAYESGVERLLFLGSSCIYPKLCPQPMKEEYLLSGYLEPTNEPYAVAKIAGIRMCQAYNRQYGSQFLAAMPTNLYGPNDNFNLQMSHVVPALIRKFLEAKLRMQSSEHAPNNDAVVVWGSGTPRREFLHVDDLADACLFLMGLHEENYQSLLTNVTSPGLVNIGSGEEVNIKELAMLIKDVVGFNGTVIFDKSMPDGTPRKICDVSKIHSLPWSHKIGLREGVKSTVEWYTRNILTTVRKSDE